VTALANRGTDSLRTAGGKVLPASMSEAHFTNAAHLEGYLCKITISPMVICETVTGLSRASLKRRQTELPYASHSSRFRQ